eukprot:9047400-Lingulodinium_polyedra.AAC.1
MQDIARTLADKGIVKRDLESLRDYSLCKDGCWIRNLQQVLSTRLSEPREAARVAATAAMTWRLRRWVEPGFDADALARVAMERLAENSAKVPPCVLLATLRTWCNGWMTDRRFQ